MDSSRKWTWILTQPIANFETININNELCQLEKITPYMFHELNIFSISSRGANNSSPFNRQIIEKTKTFFSQRNRMKALLIRSQPQNLTEVESMFVLLPLHVCNPTKRFWILDSRYGLIHGFWKVHTLVLIRWFNINYICTAAHIQQ